MKRANQLGEKGAMAIPIILAIFAIVGAGFGVWGLLRHWKSLVETQLRLDRCVAEKAVSLKSTLLTLEEENIAIEAARAAVVAGRLSPATAAATQAALALVFEQQELTLASWEITRLKWLTQRGCDGKGDIPFPLPSIPMSRLPEDAIGPNVLRWDVSPDSVDLKIYLAHRPRAAAAEVKRANGSSQSFLGTEDWQASWSSPMQSRPNFP
jgi:hypothetical protein